ncbi:MAG: ATPase domain-containing protein [Candidatus Odinarchaeia archaeon]
MSGENEFSIEITGKTKTGIKGLDEILGGGLPTAGTYLVTGSTGTGKTVLCMQYLYMGIKKYDEPGIYITLDEPPNKLRRNMRESFGWNLEKFENVDKLAIVDAVTSRISAPSDEKHIIRRGEVDSILYKTANIVGEIGAKRIVLDSIISLAYLYDNPFDLRKDLQRLFYGLGELGCTTLITTEIPPGSGSLSRFEVEEFLADGVILLEITREGNRYVRKISIRKLRGGSHSMKIYTFNITNEGIVIENEP